MNEYEVLIETVNPCGGEAHASKDFLEIEAESPDAYVAANSRYDELVAADVRLGGVFVDLLQQFRRQPDGNYLFIRLLRYKIVHFSPHLLTKLYSSCYHLSVFII